MEKMLHNDEKTEPLAVGKLFDLDIQVQHKIIFVKVYDNF